MALARQIIVRPIGLVTQPNKLGVFPPGALSQAKDFICRSPAKFQQAYTKTAWGTLLSGYRPRLLHSTANKLIVLQRDGSGVWRVEWWSHALTSPSIDNGTLPYTSDDFSQTGRLQAITMRGRTIINGATKDPIVADYENPSSTAERTFRMAGLPQLAMNSAPGEVTTGSPVAIQANTCVSYSAVLVREFADGYVMRSRPSAAFRFAIDAAPTVCDVSLPISLRDDSLAVFAKAGDYVEVYRSQSVPFTVGAETNPGVTQYLVARVALTASDISAGDVTIVDRAVASAVGGPLGGLGKDIYTNPDLGGLTSGHDPPPVAACLSVFKGRAWYANCRFPARLTLTLRRGEGDLNTADERRNGWGRRFIAATYTNASTTVSGISATDIIGLVPGQQVTDSHLPAGTTIVSVGATSIVVSAAATSGGASAQSEINDVIEIDGQTYLHFQLFGYGMMVSYKLTATRALYGAASGDFFIGTTVDITRKHYVPPATMTLRATQGSKFDPPIPEISAAVLTVQPTQRKDYVMYSHNGLPEAVPPTNEQAIGNGEIYAQISTKDTQWYCCSDGVYRLSGNIAPVNGIPDILVEQIDESLIIAGPRAWCVLRGKIYMYSNRGLVEMSDEAIRELSTGRVGDLLPGAFYAESETPFLVADERVDEIYIIGAHATLNFVYSLRYDCFTTTSQFNGATVGAQLATSLAMVFGYTTTQLDELQPDLTALLSSGPVLDLQPVFGDRPDTMKQWIDATWIFETGSSGTLEPRFNGLLVDGGGLVEPLLSAENDLRASLGISRDTPAQASGIAPGFAITSAGLKSLAGISLRYATFTEQQGRR